MLSRYILQIRRKSRFRKLSQFLNILKPTASEAVLDVGVLNVATSPIANFFVHHYPYRHALTVLGVGDLTAFRNANPDVHCVTYEGQVMPFQNKEFAVAHANAVIEHVGPFPAQELFLRELLRVSRRGMITTPNKFFFIETHTRIPFLHWLGKDLFDAMLSLRAVVTGKPVSPEMRALHLLGRRDLELLARKLHIKNWRIIRNRFWGIMTMTYSLIYFDE